MRTIARTLVALIAMSTPAAAAQLPVLRATVALHDGGDLAMIEADLLAGIAALESYGAAPFRAQAQEELGTWLVGQGRDPEAQPHLRAARATYAQLGATAWLERIGLPETSPSARA